MVYIVYSYLNPKSLKSDHTDPPSHNLACLLLLASGFWIHNQLLQCCADK